MSLSAVLGTEIVFLDLSLSGSQPGIHRVGGWETVQHGAVGTTSQQCGIALKTKMIYFGKIRMTISTELQIRT